MELFSRYLDRSNSISSVMTQEIIKEEHLRDDLKYYFMSPCEKYRARRHVPWKMGVQILKIIMVTSQLIIFGLNNQLVVSYKEENTMALKNLFLKDYKGVDEDGKLLPLIMCKKYYKRGSVEPSEEAYNIDAQLETVCMSHDPKTANLWRTENSSFFDLDFYRLVDIKITFQLSGINLQTVRSRELPDCYAFFVTITFDNQCHSGKMKIFLDIEAQSSACRDWKISGTAQKNTHYLLVFDGFVILMCLTSAVLCTRSIILAVRLLQRFSRFFHENFNRKVCEDDQREFLNGWYLLVIVSDLLAIIGSILKMEIQAKNLTNYDVCSIFLGTSTLLVWVGVIRYLGYFQKYNVLILTMKAAFPKVLRFCCCAGMIYLGYTFCGWIVLGPYHEKFEGLSLVAECLFSLLNGDDMFTTFAQLKDKNTLVWLFSRAYLYSFISLFIYMVLSLFIALITDAYETIKSYQKNGFPQTDLQKFLHEPTELPNVEESNQMDVNMRHSALCCCQRVPANDDIILTCIS
ncbi:mucolipin-2 isoform X2 [Archocentrus centrarchus]|uniref:mucolipin-2 isoform X2 n=1 Tax=Archocentrus centrarchus TaxID=63155 RepID=UPI0011EA3007|nr:mucolipin-2 isoform X2 [Archocentrus centrarchus]